MIDIFFVHNVLLFIFTNDIYKNTLNMSRLQLENGWAEKKDQNLSIDQYYKYVCVFGLLVVQCTSQCLFLEPAWLQQLDRLMLSLPYWAYMGWIKDNVGDFPC